MSLVLDWLHVTCSVMINIDGVGNEPSAALAPIARIALILTPSLLFLRLGFTGIVKSLRILHQRTVERHETKHLLVLFSIEVSSPVHLSNDRILFTAQFISSALGVNGLDLFL